MNKLILSIVAIIVVAGAAWWAIKPRGPAMAPTTSGTPVAEVSGSPSPSTSVSPSPAGANITLTSPKSGDTVDSPILVTGRARVFENQLTVQIKDDKGKVVASARVFTDAKDAGLFGNFSVRVPIPGKATTTTMKVEALAQSPKGDGSLQGYSAATVNLKYTDTMAVYAGFTTNPADCTEVTLFPREITKTSQYVYMSLVELLKGPGPQEASKGATTQIPSGVGINSFRQTGSTAYVDFDSGLQNVAGSCRVQGIRAQIEKTLKQFLGIDNVVISVNGKVDTALQP